MIINSLHLVLGFSQRCAEGSCEVNVHPLSRNGEAGVCVFLQSFSSGLSHPACITTLQCASDLIAKMSHGLLQQSLSNMPKLVINVIDVHSFMLIGANLVIIMFLMINYKVCW